MMSQIHSLLVMGIYKPQIDTSGRGRESYMQSTTSSVLNRISAWAERFTEIVTFQELRSSIAAQAYGYCFIMVKADLSSLYVSVFQMHGRSS